MDFQDYKSYATDVSTALRGVPPSAVQGVIDILKKARERNSVVYIMGNGGSAATSDHFANDLMKMCDLFSISLPSMVPSITAFGNDTGWENMFRAPLLRMLAPGDVVIGISCGGNSLNVLVALEFAKFSKLPEIATIVLTGDNLHSPIAELAPDVLISVPFRDIRVQEDCHMVVCHAIAGVLSRGNG